MRHPEEYVEAVLSIVEQIPRGRVTTYGAIADAIGRYGPRRVGNVMATHGGGVPWWRVVRADGSLPPSHLDEARQTYLEEGTPLRPSGNVDLRAAFWLPPEQA
ncbi:MAG TPA: MGMT family protein [Nocardioides sp.]|uniref:MGMT family protein n=1 Tax=Nocardioides sp. TaxID=35761 RepID=UPI002CD3B944|nr:MGMT family protein [Nocardioides sp.]HTW15724.1 MGMT family protein [Nocardioides sp.]